MRDARVTDQGSNEDKNDSGFSLIEALAGLAIFSITIVSSMTLISQTTRSTGDLEARMMARFAAENLLIETRMATTLTTGIVTGETDMAGRTYYWERRIIDTELPGLKRVSIHIREEEDKIAQLAEIHGFRRE